MLFLGGSSARKGEDVVLFAGGCPEDRMDLAKTKVPHPEMWD